VRPVARSGRARAAAALLCAVLLAGATLSASAHGDLHGQIQALSAQLADEPRNVGLLLRRAELYRDHGQWALAAADYDRVESLSPGLAALHLGRGRLWLAAGRLPEARAALDRFLALEPAHAEALANRGRVGMAQSRFAEAARDFGEAIAVSRSPDAELYLAHADALLASDPALADASLAVLDAGAARLGRPVVLGLRAVEIEGRRGHVDAALARLDALRAGMARQEAWLERRGDLNAAAGRDAAARSDWRAALAALEALPARLSGTGAMQALRARLQAKLGPDPVTR
jgi:tetratricopeptide (TPR) repeat protein